MSENIQISSKPLEDLLALDEAEFLGRAYQVTLGRHVDPEGFRNYHARLRAGESKVSILAELQSSEEGRAYEGNTGSTLELRAGAYAEIANGEGSSSPCIHIAQLLGLEDAEFVRCAYQLLLRREPDVGGLDHYVSLIRKGASKMQIVWRLCSSPEGRRVSKTVRGLRRSIIRYRLACNPLTGWWYRRLTGTEAETPLERRLRAIENSLARLLLDREEEGSQLREAAREIDALFVALTTRQT